MLRPHTAILGLLAIRLCEAQSSAAVCDAATTTTSEVPTGTPISGDYDGPYRPQAHFSPLKGFMNDPNGMFVDANSVWHLYYQYNPTGLAAGNQHWGHATSRDLYRWENQPVALFPPNDETFVFSGSVVIDPDNTSGFFPDQNDGVVAIYTLAEYPGGEPGLQTQAIAYSRDGGYSFTPYEGKPVIPSESSQFRDPKVVWFEDQWVMVIAYSQDFAIGVFTSPDLIDWTATSNFSLHGLIVLQWECPNMVRMPYIDEEGDQQDDMWLMMISINPGAPLGGSVSQYYPGSFNGTHFEAVDSVARLSDFGKDHYAGQFFYGVPEDQYPVSIAWASNWQYTNVVPTDIEGWRSTMSLPRQNYLTKVPRLGWKLVSKPYDLSSIVGDTLVSQSVTNCSVKLDFSKVESNALYWQANVTGAGTTGSLNFTFSNPETCEFVRAGYQFSGDPAFWIDRGEAKGFDNPFFTDKFSVSYLTGDKWSVSGVIDRSILEIFVDRGIESATNTFFTIEPLTEMAFGTVGLPEGAEASLLVQGLQSGWSGTGS